MTFGHATGLAAGVGDTLGVALAGGFGVGAGFAADPPAGLGLAGLARLSSSTRRRGSLTKPAL